MSDDYRFGVIGHNISYSKSPDIFRVIFDLNKINGSFDIINIKPEDFAVLFPELTGSGICGLSITTPYKITVVEYLDDIDPVGKAINAVNSISINNGNVRGFNTDCYGFSMPLRKYQKKLIGGSALILGCGGVAGAVLYSLHNDYEIRDFTILGRTEDRLQAFKTCFTRQFQNIMMNTIHGESLSAKVSDRWNIIVNCTPLGGWNLPDDLPIPEHFNLPSGMIYYDLNYNRGNKAVALARDTGLDVIDGSAMLVWQAIRSFYLWTGRDVRFEQVYGQIFVE